MKQVVFQVTIKSWSEGIRLSPISCQDGKTLARDRSVALPVRSATTNKFYSPQLYNQRDLAVWLPPSYDTEPHRRYPVLYVQDGQNLFTPFTAFQGQERHLDEVATELIKQNRIKEIIIVGIYNTNQGAAEYAPNKLGDAYSDFLITTVKPFIDATYRTRPGREDTAVMGSSLGGLIAFDLVWFHPQVFSMAGCLSPAFLVDNNDIVNKVRHAPHTTSNWSS